MLKLLKKYHYVFIYLIGSLLSQLLFQYLFCHFHLYDKYGNQAINLGFILGVLWMIYLNHNFDKNNTSIINSYIETAFLAGFQCGEDQVINSAKELQKEKENGNTQKE